MLRCGDGTDIIFSRFGMIMIISEDDRGHTI